MLTVAAAIEEPRLVRVRVPDGGLIDGEVTLYDPDTELVVVRLRGAPRLTPVPSELADAAPGNLVFATGETASGVVIAPRGALLRAGEIDPLA